MASKSRGGLSKREYAAKFGGQPMPYGSGKSSSTSGAGKLSSQLKAAQKVYEKTLKPSDEETAAEKNLDTVVQSGVLGRNKIKAEPIAQTFHVGQERVLDRQIEEQTMPIKLQIATLKARREAASNVAKSRLSFIGDAMDRTAKAKFAKSSEKSSDPEYDELKKEKLRADIAKAKRPKGSGSGASDWSKVTVEKGPTGRVRSIIERNKKTGETRRTPVK